MAEAEETQAADPWPRLRQALEQGGPAAAIALIEREPPAERRRWYGVMQQHAATEPWAGRSLDAVLSLDRAAVAELLRQAAAEADPEQERRLIDAANATSYNLSANLCDCWPDDDLPRERRHFEAGRQAAIDCLRWREQLGKGPRPFYMAWWVKGVHELSLGLAEEAVASFEQALAFAQAAGSEDGRSPELTVEGTFDVIETAGLLGLARQQAGEVCGQAEYDQAVALFEQQAAGEGEVADDAGFGLACLRKKAAA